VHRPSRHQGPPPPLLMHEEWERERERESAISSAHPAQGNADGKEEDVRALLCVELS